MSCIPMKDPTSFRYKLATQRLKRDEAYKIPTQKKNSLTFFSNSLANLLIHFLNFLSIIVQWKTEFDEHYKTSIWDSMMLRLLTHGSGPTSVRGELFYHGGATGYMPKRQSLCNCGLYEKILGTGGYISRMSHGTVSIPICLSFGGGHGHSYSKESLGFCRENASVAEVDTIDEY